MEARARVLAFVRRYPGVHAREVERRLGLSSRLASYHLEALERARELDRVVEKGYVRYLPARERWSPREIEFVCLVRRAVALRVAVLLLAEGPTTHGEVARRLDLAKASTSYHLALLEAAGVVVVDARGRERWYELADPVWVRRFLADFTPLPEDLDAFTRVWRDLFGR